MASFISNDLLVATIIEIKRNMFGIEYTTLSEFNYIKMELHKELWREDDKKLIDGDSGLFNLEFDNSIITVTNAPPKNYVLNSKLSKYLYIILELIMEYAEDELKTKKEQLKEFKSVNKTFEEKQISLLKRLSE